MALQQCNPLASPALLPRRVAYAQEAEMGHALLEAAAHLSTLPRQSLASAHVILEQCLLVNPETLLKTGVGDLCLACLVLGSKSEEKSEECSLKDLIGTFEFLGQYQAKIDSDGDEARKTFMYNPEAVGSTSYYQAKARAVELEMLILRALAFQVRPVTAYGLFINYAQALGLLQSQQDFVRIGWNCLNDILLTPVYTLVSPEAIACAAIVFAARESALGLPADLSWWTLFDVDIADITIVLAWVYDLSR